MQSYSGHEPIEGDNVAVAVRCAPRGREPTGSDVPVVSLPPEADDLCKVTPSE